MPNPKNYTKCREFSQPSPDVGKTLRELKEMSPDKLKPSPERMRLRKGEHLGKRVRLKLPRRDAGRMKLRKWDEHLGKRVRNGCRLSLNVEFETV
jgi:hypothetical protein